MSQTVVVGTPPQHGSVVQSSQAGQADNQALHGHIFGDTIVQDRASAHFGDSYTSYHIYSISEGASSAKRSSLTIGDALTGILAGSARAIAFVSTLSNPSPTLRGIQEELTSLRIILSSLQRFVDHGSDVSSERASLIELEDMITVMTQLVLLYSELEELIAHYARQNRRKSAVLFFAGKPARLLSGLQRHKLTLSIILQILQCRFNHEAQSQAVILSSRTEHELESEPTLAQRLLHLDPIEDAGEEAASITRESSSILLDTNAVEVTNHSLLSPETRVKGPAFLRRHTSEGLATNDVFYGIVVAQSRVYRRVEHLEIDAASACRSTRSHGWSILSGLTASQVTCVGVINLPLNGFELIRFRNYLPAHGVYDSVQGTGVCSGTPKRARGRDWLMANSYCDFPNIDKPLVPEMAYLYKNDRSAYHRTARWKSPLAGGLGISRVDEDSSKSSQVNEPQLADAQDQSPTRELHRAVEIETEDTLDLITMRQCHRIVEIETI